MNDYRLLADEIIDIMETKYKFDLVDGYTSEGFTDTVYDLIFVNNDNMEVKLTAIPFVDILWTDKRAKQLESFCRSEIEQVLFTE